MGFQVYLSRVLFRNREMVGCYVRKMDLPIPPVVGMMICLHSIEDDVEIKSIWITPKGVAVCDVDDNHWSTSPTGEMADCCDADWPEVVEHETEGWTQIEFYETLEP